MEQEIINRVTIRPFHLDKRFTKFSNPVIDHIMPRVSPPAWKVLTVIWRQTEGWLDRQTGKRKQWDEISYSQFMERTGIGSTGTIRRALKELMEGGYIVRRPAVGPRGRQKKQSFQYSLKPEIEVEIRSLEDQ